jgi:hypothetical protein
LPTYSRGNVIDLEKYIKAKNTNKPLYSQIVGAVDYAKANSKPIVASKNIDMNSKRIVQAIQKDIGKMNQKRTISKSDIINPLKKDYPINLAYLKKESKKVEASEKLQCHLKANNEISAIVSKKASIYGANSISSKARPISSYVGSSNIKGDIVHYLLGNRERK